MDQETLECAALAWRETTNSPHCSAKASQWPETLPVLDFRDQILFRQTNIFMKIENVATAINVKNYNNQEWLPSMLVIRSCDS